MVRRKKVSRKPAIAPSKGGNKKGSLAELINFGGKNKKKVVKKKKKNKS